MKTSRTESANEIETSSTLMQRILAWSDEAVLWSKYWLDSGLVGYFEEVRVALIISQLRSQSIWVCCLAVAS